METLKRPVKGISITHLIDFIDRQLSLSSNTSDSLFTGNLGNILFYQYSFLSTQEEKYLQKVYQLLRHFIQNIASSSVLRSASLSSGLSGLGWILLLLKKHGFISNQYEKLTNKIDEIIYQKTIENINLKNFDYMHGSIGSMVYLTKRVEENGETIQYLEKIIKAILKAKIKTTNGTYIKSEYIFRKFKNVSDQDLNIGLAHGFTGILLGLLKVSEQKIETSDIEQTIFEGIDFILSLANQNNQDDLERSIFPTNYLINQPLENIENQYFYSLRTGWCYGDLNEVMLLYKANQAFDNSDWLQLAHTLGERCTNRRTKTQTQVEDAGLCHGSSVLSQMYQSLHRSNFLSCYFDATNYWSSQTDKYIGEIGDNDHPNLDFSFLNGLVGTALSKISEENPHLSDWQELMMID